MRRLALALARDRHAADDGAAGTVSRAGMACLVTGGDEGLLLHMPPCPSDGSHGRVGGRWCRHRQRSRRICRLTVRIGFCYSGRASHRLHAATPAEIRVGDRICLRAESFEQSAIPAPRRGTTGKQHSGPSAEYRYEYYDLGDKRHRRYLRPSEPNGHLDGEAERLGRSFRGNGRERHRVRAADGRAAEDAIPVVEDGGLALGHAAGGAVQPDMQRVVR